MGRRWLTWATLRCGVLAIATGSLACEQILGFDDARIAEDVPAAPDDSRDGRYLIRSPAFGQCLASTSWSDGFREEFDAWVRPCGNRDGDGSTNLLSDASFEAGSTDVWDTWGQSGIEAHPTDPNGGNVAAITDRGSVAQVVPLEPTTAYLFGLALDPNGTQATVGVKNHGFPEQFEFVTGSGFLDFSLPFVTGDSAEAAEVYLMNGGADPGATVYGDDFFVEPAADVPADHLWDLRAVTAAAYAITNAQHDPVRLLTALHDPETQSSGVAALPAADDRSQRFELVESSGTTYSIRAADLDGQCLSVGASQTATLAACDSTDDHQRWELVCVSGRCALDR